MAQVQSRGLALLSRRVAFVAFAATLVALYLGSGAPTPFLLQWQSEWGFPDSLLTVAFAAYAFAFLVALLVGGSLSDHLGRKPVIITLLAVSLIPIAMFAFGPSVEWIIAGRTLAGLTTGAVTAAYTAALVELATPGSRTGPLIAAAAPVGGLGLGALLGGVAIELWHQDADVILFSAIGVALLIGIVLTVVAPETTTRVPGALRSLVPQVLVPRPARPFFARMLPILIAAWATGSLFLGLAPTIVHELLGIQSGLVNGATASIHAFGVCIGSVAFGRLAVPTALRLGGLGLAVGVSLVVVGVATGQITFVVIGGVIEGLSFGAAFGGIFRGLAPLAPDHERAGTFASVYVVAYISLGVPAVIAGQLIAPLGLLPVILGWGLLIVLLAAAGVVIQLRRPRALA
ncbi:MAG: MFS transporter [Pseudolysinimonas sp.]|uniref:MFS transporter n=1 Tax=Pseudolysinimonas sp. TaxID=2680009 RepID=UPI0032662578